eukprot:gb/GECG01010753.1/.p1 GENE.gb/GECG01010753.1/~~gb/GECG01010753.1/.p1  ORF type:complete len:314 (+),score=53.49 gb/GECG01010753.1/:1-942(+)
MSGRAIFGMFSRGLPRSIHCLSTTGVRRVDSRRYLASLSQQSLRSYRSPVFGHEVSQSRQEVFRRNCARGELAVPLIGGSTSGHRGIFVEVEQTPNPDSMKFIPDEGEVLPEEYGSSMHFSSLHDAKGSKLVRQILKIPHVTSVFLTNEFISVNKEEEADWDAVRTLVLHAILDHYAEGGPIVTDAPVESDTAIQEGDSEIVATVKELLETRIRPAIQEDGGDIFYAGFDEDTNIVRVKMAGSCVGCPSSTVTLRNGVENMLKHYVPEVEGIEQVTEAGDGTEQKMLSEEEEEEQQANESLRQKLAAAGVPGA